MSAEQGWRIAEAEESGDEKEPVKKKGEKGAEAKKGRGKGSAKGKSTRKGKAAAAKGKGKVSFLSCTAHTHISFSPSHLRLSDFMKDDDKSGSALGVSRGGD